MKEYFKRALPRTVFSDYYIITEEFKSICEGLDSGDKVVTIHGPRGVGKSMALGAIATLCYKQRPCILWSPIAHKEFQSYVGDIQSITSLRKKNK